MVGRASRWASSGRVSSGNRLSNSRGYHRVDGEWRRQMVQYGAKGMDLFRRPPLASYYGRARGLSKSASP